MRNAEQVPQVTRDYLRWAELRFGPERMAAWLGTCRQHLGKELPKVGAYTVSLVAALGPDAAQAIGRAVLEGLRLFYQGQDTRGLEPMSDAELEQYVREKRGGRPGGCE